MFKIAKTYVQFSTLYIGLLLINAVFNVDKGARRICMLFGLDPIKNDKCNPRARPPQF